VVEGTGEKGCERIELAAARTVFGDLGTILAELQSAYELAKAEDELAGKIEREVLPFSA
jgi:hypothetical protein